MKKDILSANSKYHQQVVSLFQELSKYEDKTLNSRPADGGWSAIQTVHHLILVEDLGLRYVQKKLSFGTPIGQGGFKEKMKLFLLKTYAALPIKFPAPQGVGDDHIPDSMSLEETKERWMLIRQRWTEFFETMPDSMLNTLVFKHPIAGRMTWKGMLEFHQEHMKRHIKQIRKAVS